MIGRVYALSYARMKELLRTRAELLESEVFISALNSQGNEPQAQLLPADGDRWVTLRFDDINTQGVQQLTEAEAGRLVVFGPAQADRIIDLVLACQELPGTQTLIVNCGAGACRSGAIATFVRDVLGLPYDQFRRDNPQITPNDLVLRTLVQRWMARTSSQENV
jgi:predicted protein tyrosine phosphatase